MTPAAHQSSRPLAALRATVLESLFCSWSGRSGRRYICSIHPITEEPAFDCGRAVVAAVRPSFSGAAIAFVFLPRTDGDDFPLWARRARSCGASAFHVHLLAETEGDRAATASDLRPAPIFTI
ncbi:hypothetical protein GJ654_06540 [Rhodoblastus acidophilus]|uniref:Uncharacterized protein n=1 Tax=Rhodoblastus acidophilus TaxID=1074 RepID=A0A6N8DJD4_RHOAC|nr:hypothetical protein [Rhodoblastus acidophilus]MCW2274077.1 hypothetical protein [Rhodoblastus acidophilus]MTV30650.1 hypothetical protein [Rhodoblastus acidophilus]